MQLYTEDRTLPLVRLLMLGVALTVWNDPAKAFAGSSSALSGGQHARPAARPEAFPGFSPDDPGKCPELIPLSGHDTSRFESRLFAMPLPADLTPQQQQAALAIMREAEPHLTILHRQLRQTLAELHNLSFASDTPPDALAVIGRRLIRLRSEALRELQRLSGRMEQLAGFNPGWGTRVRGTKLQDLDPQPLYDDPDE